MVGEVGLKNMVLREGDFIEDRFGQGQRNSLVAMSSISKIKTKELVTWFGSYLIWPRNASLTEDQRIMVKHLRGRKSIFLKLN